VQSDPLPFQKKEKKVALPVVNFGANKSISFETIVAFTREFSGSGGCASRMRVTRSNSACIVFLAHFTVADPTFSADTAVAARPSEHTFSMYIARIRSFAFIDWLAFQTIALVAASALACGNARTRFLAHGQWRAWIVHLANVYFSAFFAIAHITILAFAAHRSGSGLCAYRTAMARVRSFRAQIELNARLAAAFPTLIARAAVRSRSFVRARGGMVTRLRLLAHVDRHALFAGATIALLALAAVFVRASLEALRILVARLLRAGINFFAFLSISTETSFACATHRSRSIDSADGIFVTG
jgi:hypothetical protein